MKPLSSTFQRPFSWKRQILLPSLFLLLLFSYSEVHANSVDTTGTNCGCDIIISPGVNDGQAYLDGQQLGVKPGNKVCLVGSHFVSISLFHFYGTKNQPVTIINCGGLVTISGYSAYGFALHSSRYVNISGSGDAAYPYGILVDGSVANTTVGFAEDGEVSDISVDHMEVSKAGLGMACAPTPNCDSTTWASSWKMYNMNFHDNYVHETFYEGFYIGNTQNYYTLNCGSSQVTVQPQQIDSVRFYNNIIDKAGYTAAQISQVTGGADIHDNLITNYGYLNKPEHDAGLIVGGISHGMVYRNKILNGTGSAFQYFGAGLTQVFNNIFAWAGYDGSVQGQNAVLMDDRPKPPGFPPLKIFLINNTIVGPKRSGISFYNDYGTVDYGNIIASNIIAAPGFLAIEPLYAYFDIQANPHVSLLNNLTVPTTALAGFVNAANSNFHLLPGSPAIDSGFNAAVYGITTDMDGNHRPFGKGYDIGAYEYNGGIAPSLVANAGPYQTITLPVNSASLDGSHSFDPAGRIISYGWSELSGPSTATIGNNSLVSTTASGLVQGTYIFNLVVRDNQGATATARDTILVKPPQVAPTVSAGAPQTITLPISSVSLQGVATPKNGASIKSTAWSELSGPNNGVIATSGLNANVSGLVAGAYVFQFSATDNNGLSASSTVSVTVNLANLPPTVSAGGDQTITLPLSSVNLTGTATGNNGATITTTSWTELSGPNSATISSSGLSSTVTGMIAGNYVFQFSATENNGLSSSSTVNVTVNRANIPPTVSAGVAQTITLPLDSVNLSGTATGNNGAIISTTVWTELSGPNTATIVSPGLITSVTGLVEGVYIFRLTATDTNGLSSSSDVTIIVHAASAQPPTVSAGVPQTITLPLDSVILTGSATGSNGVGISSTTWIQTSGPGTSIIATPASTVTKITGLLVGTYVYQLTAVDSNGLSSASTVTITVNAANLPPTVNAGPDQTITLPVNSVTLTGTATGSSGIGIARTSWVQNSGPGSSAIETSTSSVTAVSLLLAGVYVFQFTAFDNNGLSASSTVTITVNPANIPPTVNAGPDQTVTLPVNSVTITGTANGNGGASISTITWTETGGPNTATIGSLSSLTSTVSGLQAGVYSLELTATDDKGLSSKSTVTITVNPARTPPTVNAGQPQTIVLPTSTINLTGTATAAGGATISSTAWTQLDGPNSANISSVSSLVTSVSGLVAGVYHFLLTAVDNNGLSDSSSVAITVNSANGPPNVNAGRAQTINPPASSVTLNGTASGNNGATISSIQWKQATGPNTAMISSDSSLTTNVTGLVLGFYVFQLTATDNNGLSNVSTVFVNVNAATQPPVAIAGPDQTITLPVDSVNLDGTGSSDPDGSIASYNWVVVSYVGSVTIVNSNTATPKVLNLQAGQYIFGLTVVDNIGDSGKAQVTITVNREVILPPNANAGQDTTITIPSDTAILNGSASTDPSGTITTYQWTQLSGPSQARIILSNAPVSVVSNLSVGDYVFTLTVTNNRGLSSQASVKVHVVSNLRYTGEIKLYPNPVHGILNLRLIGDSVGAILVNIYDINGRIVQAIQLIKDQQYFYRSFDVSGLANGVYFLQTVVGIDNRMSTKFIKD